MNHEFDAIRKLFQQRVSQQDELTHVANGDDASVHIVPDGLAWVQSTDTSIVGVHCPEDMALAIAGHRAVCSALSDLAAMGAKAHWLWLAVMAKSSEDLEQMSLGMVQACLEYKIELAGGDTTSCPNTNAITVTVAGLLPENSAMTRKAAKEGDEIWLLGDMGLSALGLKLWQDESIENNAFTAKQQQALIAFQQIKPLLEQGVKLRQAGVSCCIDISDGLLQDAGHIAKASQVAMHIDVEKIQALPAFVIIQRLEPALALSLMLQGSEDYALLCTAPTSLHQTLKKMGASLIGSCHAGNRVILLEYGEPITFEQKGFDHFE